jgi:hypothetical protein
MNTQDLINEANAAKGIHCDGFRKNSETHNGVNCEVICRTTYNKKTGEYVHTQRAYFWDGSLRISRAAAEEILAGNREEKPDYSKFNIFTGKFEN